MCVPLQPCEHLLGRGSCVFVTFPNVVPGQLYLIFAFLFTLALQIDKFTSCNILYKPLGPANWSTRLNIVLPK